MKFAILILFLCLSTYIPRMLPALFMDRVKVSGKFVILASVVVVIAALKNLPVIGVVLSSVISCVIFYMFILS